MSEIRWQKKIKDIDDTGLVTAAYTSMEQSPTGFGVLIVHGEGYSSKNRPQTPNVTPEKLREKFPNKAIGVAGEGKYRATREEIPIVVTQSRRGEV